MTKLISFIFLNNVTIEAFGFMNVAYNIQEKRSIISKIVVTIAICANKF